jgi:hypothetical protein
MTLVLLWEYLQVVIHKVSSVVGVYCLVGLDEHGGNVA